MAKPTLAQKKAAYGSNYSEIVLEPSTILVTPTAKKGDLDMLRQNTPMQRLANPQKKVSFTKKKEK